MDRRAFLAAIGLAPFATVATPTKAKSIGELKIEVPPITQEMIDRMKEDPRMIGRNNMRDFRAMKRFSSNENDPGFQNWAILRSQGKNVRAFVDGSEVKHAATSDERLGYVVCAIEDPETGRPMVAFNINGISADCFAEQVIYGKVTHEIY